MTQSKLLLSLTTASLCALAVSFTAQAAVNEHSKPRNRLAAKIKPQPVATPAAEEVPLSEAQLAVASLVNHGEAHCEFNQKVSLSPNPDKPGRFRLQFGKMVYDMAPEPTTTGAVRLEDKKAGVVWLQIPSKSMLMNSKLGQRMVDSCMHPVQQAAAEATPAADSGIGITPGTSITTH